MAVGGQEWEAGFGYETGGPSEVDPALLASDLTDLWKCFIGPRLTGRILRCTHE